MKYKPCCEFRCCVMGCKQRDRGGCYCVCRLKGYEDTLLNLLEGKAQRIGGAIIYRPGLEVSVSKEEKSFLETELKKIRDELKTYEIVDEE